MICSKKLKSLSKNVSTALREINSLIGVSCNLIVLSTTNIWTPCCEIYQPITNAWTAVVRGVSTGYCSRHNC